MLHSRISMPLSNISTFHNTEEGMWSKKSAYTKQRRLCLFQMYVLRVCIGEDSLPLHLASIGLVCLPCFSTLNRRSSRQGFSESFSTNHHVMQHPRNSFAALCALLCSSTVGADSCDQCHKLRRLSKLTCIQQH